MQMQIISQQQIENFLQERIATDLDMNKESISMESDLSDIGLSSVLISFAEGDLESWLNIEIPPALLFQTANIREAAKALVELQKEQHVTTQSPITSETVE